MYICRATDRLLHVPNAQPPLPSDWEVRPTWTVHHVPYYLAPLWDLRAEERSRSSASKKPTSTSSEFGRVPQELKAKLKKSKGARTLLQELELEVRKFVREYESGMKGERWDEQTGDTETETETETEVDSEDEEIVFIGRNGRMSDEARARVERVLEREKKVWEGDVNDRGAGFGYVPLVSFIYSCFSSSTPLQFYFKGQTRNHLIFTLRNPTNTTTDAGSSIPSQNTTASHPAPSPWGIRHAGRHTLLSGRLA